MKHHCSTLAGTTLLTTLFASTVFAQPPALWQAPFSGTEANGPHVIGLWHFDAAAPGKDASGHGYDLTLRGKDSRFIAPGKFDGALQIDLKTEPGDTRQGASTPDRDELTPQGAFSIEMWIAPDENLAKQSGAYLLDKKNYHYASGNPRANHDYLLRLKKQGANAFVVEAQLGFGNDSAILNSTPQEFKAGQWYHLAFSYNGRGKATLFLNGKSIGQSEMEGRGAVSNGPHPLVIGDRIGSSGQRFPGLIDEVRVSSQAVDYAAGKGVQLENTSWRTAYLRLEENVNYQLRVTNNTAQPLDKASIHLQTAKLPERRIDLPLLQPGESVTITAPVETMLRPDRYQVEFTVQNAALQAVSETLTLPLTIVARPNPQRLPVILRDYGEYQQVKDIGFTHMAVSLVDYDPIWEKGADGNTASATTTKLRRQALDQMLALQLGGIAPLAPGRYISRNHPELNRIARSGKTLDNVDGLFPRVQQFGNDVGVAVARSFKDSPAWAGSSINSEHRDGTAPSFHAVDKEAYRHATGQEIPSQVVTARGVFYQSLPDFPANRVVADDYPILNYYRWYWKNGDGWNLLNSQVNQGMKSAGRPDLFSMYDPATRAPSLWGSGGDVDYLNHWTYTYPDPLRIALAGDELLAMTAGQAGQKVMNMTQLIWYRSRTTKTPAAGQESDWEKALPKAQFISISPDHLSEALWLKLSRPLQAIAYHGWGSMGESVGDHNGGYFTTNPQTRKRLQSLLQEVVEPLGPTLRQLPDAPTDVAFLESFASQMLAGRGSYGWSNWSADSYYIACYAGLQPQVIYEETIHQKGLDAYKVLFLTDCDVLTASVVEAIKKFQQRGGLVIGDERLTPTIQPDIYLSSLARGKNTESKPQLLQKASELRAELDPFYERAAATSNPDVILRTRRAGDADYLFTVNDNRTFGDYVGQYGLVMEKGLPAQSKLTLNRKEGFVYDLVNHRQVTTQRQGNQLQLNIDLGAGEGNVFLITPRPVGGLQVEVNKEVARGQNLPIAMQLNDDTGHALQAVVPLQVAIRDRQGRLAEQSGYYGALNGRHTLQLMIAPNDETGTWQIEVTEGLRGQKVVQTFEVR